MLTVQQQKTRYTVLKKITGNTMMIISVDFSKMCGSLRNLCFVLKERAELVHKVHLLCLLARGRIVDNACNDPLIQVNKLYPFTTAVLAVALKLYFP